jgi:hypothetical protein
VRETKGQRGRERSEQYNDMGEWKKGESNNEQKKTQNMCVQRKRVQRRDVGGENAY